MVVQATNSMYFIFPTKFVAAFPIKAQSVSHLRSVISSRVRRQTLTQPVSWTHPLLHRKPYTG